MKDGINTPVADFLREYEEGGASRLHMPGHKGRAPGAARDITELPGADDLFHPCGIIKESEENASALFGARTLYSTEGSSLAIRAMVHLAAAYARERGEVPLIAAARGVHKSFISALALTGADVDWLCPEGSTYMSSPLSAECLENYFRTRDRLPVALYITSPDYLGNMQDTAALSAVCRKYGALLLVDNAHGAYLKFLTPSLHPMDRGADMCADSAHKTLPALTGGAYLHISHSAPAGLYERAKDAMALYASTSPSYLITESLDLVNRHIASGYEKRLAAVAKRLSEVKERLAHIGFGITGTEPMKITLATKPYGYSGRYVDGYLRKNGIFSEFSDDDYLVLMPSDMTELSELDRLSGVLEALPRREALTDAPPPFSLPRAALSVREAVFAPSELLPLSECSGRVLSDARLGCPPAVPIAVPGEVIDEKILGSFGYYGIEEIYVVKNTSL